MIHAIAAATILGYLTVVCTLTIKILRGAGDPVETPLFVRRVHQLSALGLGFIVVGSLFSYGWFSTAGSYFLLLSFSIEALGWYLSVKHPIFRAKISGLAAFFLLMSSYLSHWSLIPIRSEKAEGWGFVLLHVAPALVGEAALLLSVVCASMYISQDYLLRKRKIEALLSRLPSLETLDKGMTRYAGISFLSILLAALIGIVAGMLYETKALQFDITQSLAYISLILSGIAFSLRYWKLWSAPKVAVLLVCAVTAFFVVYTISVSVSGVVTHKAIKSETALMDSRGSSKK